jgi:hypothetical protein
MLSIGNVQVFQGGLFRCCIAYLTEIEDLEAKSTDGATLECGYCNAHLIYRDGRWEWDKEVDDG